MEDDIANYSPTVMFRGTPCKQSYLESELLFCESRHQVLIDPSFAGLHTNFIN